MIGHRILLLSFPLFSFFPLGSCSANQPRVTIENGVVVGSYATSRYGYLFRKFEGIPYAKPPIDGRRFKEPERLDEEWIGEWNATAPGSACLQYDHFNRFKNEKGDWEFNVVGDEDCLFLNVYTREGGPADKNVIVFIHGGAFMFGSSNAYEPEYLMTHDNIIFVTMNYRLGPLGFLSTGDSVVPGNNGLKDQSAALQWVQRNIGAFGGDPSKVTLAGLSAGGVSVHFHYLSPLSKGLFTKGYSYSGTTLCPWAMLNDGPQKTKQLATLLGCPTTDSKVILKCLRRRPARKIVEQMKNFKTWHYNPFAVFGPVVEAGSINPFIDKAPREIIRNGEAHDLPWISGFTSEDGLYNAADFVDDDRFLRHLNEKWEDLAPGLVFYSQEPKKAIAKEIRGLYLGEEGFSRATVPQIIQMYSDRLFIGPAVKASILQAKANSAPVYLYQYSYKDDKSTSQLMSGTQTTFGASHGDDMAYVIKFYNHETHETQEDKAMSNVLMDIFLTFVETGAPPQSLNWEPVGRKGSNTVKYLHIKSPSEIRMEEETDVGNVTKWDLTEQQSQDCLFLYWNSREENKFFKIFPLDECITESKLLFLHEFLLIFAHFKSIGTFSAIAAEKLGQPLLLIKLKIMEKCEKIISGPESSGQKLTGSFAENLIPRMRKRAKDHIAQVEGATGETITTLEFLRMSLEVTEGLIEFGVGEKDVVSLLSPNNIKTMATALGVLFSGAIFAPVDHNLKPAEWKVLLKQFQPKYVICENKRRDAVQKCLKEAGLNPKIILIDSKSTYDGEFFLLDDLRKKVDVENYVPKKVKDPKKQAAVILCSSGSTGLPKGVALSHYTLLRNCLAGEDMDVGDNPFIITSPLYWISGLMVFIVSCYVGTILYIPKSTNTKDFLEGIHNYKPLFLLVSPSSILELVSHPDVKNYDLSSIKVIFIAGAVLGLNGFKKIKEVFPEVILIPSYGMTEAGGSIAMLKGPFKDLVLGNVLPDVRVKVVDVDTGESLGPHKPGECRIKTPAIMLGYYNNEEATKAAFDEGGWLRTGDLVHYDEDEVLYIVGRIKEVVKCRNYQVSLSELEAFIIGLPGVKDVAVIPIPDEVDINHFKALVVKDPKSHITADDIVRSVEDNYSYQKQLHEGVEFVDSLPRSEVGKLKRAQLLKN